MSLLVYDSVVSSVMLPEQLGRRIQRFVLRKVAVLGAGTMGARIAAHIANAGLPVLLLDVASDKGDRSAPAAVALRNLASAKPPAFAATSVASRISTGNFQDDLHRLKDCDWVIEAVAENLEIKRSLLANVHLNLGPDAILTTNTSGLPVAQVGAQLPDELKKRWFGTHFFNPPRYMKLVELIAPPEADAAAIAVIADFCDRHLGKDIVPANDVPNFIANRIGTFMMLNTLNLMQKHGLTPEDVNLLTGPIIGWPKTGTFRLADLVGIDVMGSTAINFLRCTQDERSDLKLPPVVEELMTRKWLGDKTGNGFYKKGRGADGKEIRSVLDFETFEYRPPTKPSFLSVDQANQLPSTAARIHAFLNSSSPDAATGFYQQLLSDLWLYSAHRIGEVARSVVEIDSAMTSGYNWQLGPFAMWDAAGVPETVAKMKRNGAVVPPAVEALLASGGSSWYRNDGAEFFDITSGSYQPVRQSPDHAHVSHYRSAHPGSAGIFAENASVSLVDVGDGIGCFEFHSKMNALNPELVKFLRDQLEPGGSASRVFDGFVITSDAQNFSVGADLTQLIAAIEAQDWASIELGVRQFHAMTQAIKFSARPVISAPFGMCLGGGTEIALHSALRQPYLELNAGLVETGVGLIPGGGGCKEMLIRALAAADSVRHDIRGESAQVFEALKSSFETILMAKVSTSAIDARALRIIDAEDTISMNRDRLLTDAKTQALRLVRSGYTAPVLRNDIPAPGDTIYASLKLGVYLARQAEYISDHDVLVAGHVARVLTGGDITPGTLLSEDDLLAMEREAFLSLCGEARTQDRIRFTLKTGKPLRN